MGARGRPASRAMRRGERRTALGASSPANPALHIPEPFCIEGHSSRSAKSEGQVKTAAGTTRLTSMTRAATSSAGGRPQRSAFL